MLLPVSVSQPPSGKKVYVVQFGGVVVRAGSPLESMVA